MAETKEMVGESIVALVIIGEKKDNAAILPVLTSRLLVRKL